MKASKFRNVIVLLCVLFGILNYLDRSAIAFFAVPIMKTFHVDHAGFGLIASAFGIGYLVFTCLGGWLADTIGARRIFGIAGLVWGISTAAVGVATGFGGLFAARAALGAAEGPVYPAMIKLFTDWMHGHARTTAVAYAIPVSVGLGVILGGPIASFVLATTHIWQVMFYGLGVVSIIMGLLMYFVIRDDPAESKYVNKAELDYIRSGGHAASHRKKYSGPIAIKISEMFGDLTLLSVYYGFFALGYFFWFTLTWLPNFLEVTFKISLASSALFSILPWIGYIVGSLIGGYLSDRGTRITGSHRTKKHLIWISLIGATIIILPVVMIHSLAVALICFSFALGVAGICVPPLFALNADVCPQRPGLSSGFMDGAFALAGILAPLISGFVVQLGGGFGMAIVFAAIVTASGALCVIFLNNPDKAAQKFINLERQRQGTPAYVSENGSLQS